MGNNRQFIMRKVKDMRKYEYIHPIDEMEHISRKELGERLDEIIDKIDSENVGFIISDDNKNDLISIELDKDWQMK